MARTNLKLQDICEIFGKWSCLAQCYIYAALKDVATPEELNNEDFINIAILSNLYMFFKNQDNLDEECTVLDANKLMYNVNGKKYKVEEKNDITSLKDLENVPRAVVLFEYDDKGHSVYCEFGKIVFNSLRLSKCVTMGKPTAARIIKDEE